ncbi:MAG: hypothetical protein CSA49_05620 [Gammaproteobacteria bacterium]|nr:MAG: hypothetical protein CSA49_05620 [Gammaproteobacteria bacterium]
MHKLDRITINPEMMNGQPCIRDTRLTVKRVLEALAVYPDWDELMEEYPGLERDDIRQALELAAHSLDDEVIRLGLRESQSITRSRNTVLDGTTLKRCWMGCGSYS